jgi:hypothetical protein
MGVLLQGFYKLGPKRAVPSPSRRRSQDAVVVGSFGDTGN